MTPEALVEAVLELKGVTGAALMTGSGELLAGAPEGAGTLFVTPELLTSSLAPCRALAELLGAEAATQATIEFEEGALLLTLAAEGGGSPAEAPVSVVCLRSVQDLGRVRFSLRRLLPQLTLS